MDILLSELNNTVKGPTADQETAGDFVETAKNAFDQGKNDKKCC